jgi:hypothetical protein
VQSLAQHNITRSLNPVTNLPKALIILVIVSIVSGIATGYFLSQKNSGGALITSSTGGASTGESNVAIPAQAESTACPDFAEGTLKAKDKPADPSQYSEGTHLLERTGQTPVTLTSSTVDLTKFEGKKVKVFGATQKALKAGWLMDVCKVDVE